MKWIIAGACLFVSMAAQAANQNTQRILGLTQAQQNKFFTLVLKKESCDRVTRTMYQGGTSDGDDSWNVGCENGNDYSVGIPTDINAIKILTCKEVVLYLWIVSVRMERSSSRKVALISYRPAGVCHRTRVRLAHSCRSRRAAQRRWRR
jgi:hypothetical protein